MKKLAGIIGLALLALVILAVGVLFFLTRLFDPNDYKEQIQQAAREQANIELTLGGDIGWSLFPWLGIELKQVGIAPVGQPEQPLADVGSVGLGVEVLPLLRRELRMSDVILDSVRLNLLVDEKGVANWSTVGPQAQAEGEGAEAVEQGRASAEAEAERHGQLQVSVQSVRITNARIEYTDRQANQHLLLEEVNLRTGALIDQQPFDVEFLGLLLTDQPATRARIDLKTVASFSLADQLYQLDGFDLKVDASGDLFNGRATGMRLQGDALVDLAEQTAQLRQLRMALADLRATGELSLTGLDSEPALVGSIDIAQFDARTLLHDLGQELPDMAHAAALSRIALSADLEGSANSLMLNDLRLQLDGTELRGRLGLEDLSKQALRFELSGDRLNIDHYLPPTEQTADSASSAPAQGGSSSTAKPEPWSNEPLLPLETLAGLNVHGSLDLQQVQLTGQSISPFTLTLEAADGNIRLRRFEGGVFGGQFSATGTLGAGQLPAPLTLKGKLSGMDSQALQRAYEMPEQVRGRLNLEMDLRTRGNSMRSWIDELNGNLSFDVSDGALLGVNLEQRLCQAIALANREALTSDFGAENTPFNKLTGSFRIVNGTVQSRDLVASLPGITAKGNGDIHLPEQRLDYGVALVLEGDQREMPDPACRINQRYVGVEWPLRCEGYLHNAAKSCGVDTQGVTRIAGQLLRNEAERKIGDKVEEKLEEKLGEQAPAVRDAIRGLFNR
ncbi:AsmA family protein [Halopseudomonas sp. Lyrl_26]|uniref:AsmA family protein n=1 Tax=Halopseudomonas sp. Lyrl_26 TaxID=3110923 RepID=UPI003F8231FA